MPIPTCLLLRFFSLQMRKSRIGGLCGGCPLRQKAMVPVAILLMWLAAEVAGIRRRNG